MLDYSAWPHWNELSQLERKMREYFPSLFGRDPSAVIAGEAEGLALKQNSSLHKHSLEAWAGAVFRTPAATLGLEWSMQDPGHARFTTALQ